MSKVGLGAYTNDPEVVEAVKRSKARLVLLFEGAISLAPAIKAVCPDILTIGRWWLDPIQYVPLDLAEAYQKGRLVADALDIPAHPKIDAWQSYCEYINSTKSTDEWLAYNQFELGFTRRVHDRGKKSVIGNIPVGNGTVFQLLLMKEALAEADFFAYHGYTSPDNHTVDDHCFGRFKSWIAEYQRQGLRFPPVILTEIGTYYPFKHCENYRENQCIEVDLPPILEVMSAEMQALDYLVGGDIFCKGDCGGWTGFDISEEGDLYIVLLARLNSVPTHRYCDASRKELPMARFKIGNVWYDSLIEQLPVREGAALYKRRAFSDIEEITIHHSGSDTYATTPMALATDMTQHQTPERTKYPEIPYHIIIEPDGLITVVQPLDALTWHADGGEPRDGVGINNWRGVGIVLIGDFTNHPPSGPQMAALSELCPEIDFAMGKRLRRVRHSDVQATQCPGATSRGYDNWFEALFGDSVIPILTTKEQIKQYAQEIIRLIDLIPQA